MAAAALHPDYPLVVVAHGEAESQVRNAFEEALVEPVLRALADPKRYGLEAEEGLGVSNVVDYSYEINEPNVI